MVEEKDEMEVVSDKTAHRLSRECATGTFSTSGTTIPPKMLEKKKRLYAKWKQDQFARGKISRKGKWSKQLHSFDGKMKDTEVDMDEADEEKEEDLEDEEEHEHEHSRKPSRGEHLYIFKNSRLPEYKIGRSSNTLTRSHQLQTAQNFYIQTVAVFENKGYLEGKVRTMLAYCLLPSEVAAGKEWHACSLQTAMAAIGQAIESDKVNS